MKTSELDTRSVHGFVLVEAMVALVVVSIGILGIVKLNSVLIQGSGYTKARAEAINIAQDRIERARDFNLQSGCSDTTLVDSSETVTGINANYDVAVSYPTPSGTNWKTVQACVTWDGGNCNTVGNRIILRTVLACSGTGTSGQVGPAGAGASLGGFIKNPTGRAVVGGIYNNGTESINSISVNGTDIDDGTKISKTSDSTQLVATDGSNTVLLTMSKRACESAAPDFSTISGKVYIGAKNGAPIAPEEHLFVLSSDASYCSVLPYDLANWKVPAGSSGNNIKYFYTYYRCYIGAEWWGNIGVVRTDNANANNRVCTGNPRSVNSNTIFSKHAQLGTTRGYRGYRETSPGVYETKGIGENDEKIDACSSGSLEIFGYKPINYENHDFVHTVLTGSISDTACSTEMSANLPGLLAPGSGGDVPPILDPSGAVDISTASFNPGKYYCLSSSDGISCPNLVNPPPQPSTTLTGTITASDDIQVGLNESAADTACVSYNINQTSYSGTTRTYNFSCTIDWTGFTAGSWSGQLRFSTKKLVNGSLTDFGTICPDGASATVTPATESVAYAIRDSSVATDPDTSSFPNSLFFSDIPNPVTGIVVNFTAKQACAGLGQVDLRWAGGAVDPQNLTWTAILGATAYEVQRCTTTSTNNISPCSPSSTVSTVTTTAYALNSVGNKDTTCVKVRATTSTQQGPWSPVKCVYRTGNNYTYQ